MAKRRRFTAKFKAEVVLEALRKVDPILRDWGTCGELLYYEQKGE